MLDTLHATEEMPAFLVRRINSQSGCAKTVTTIFLSFIIWAVLKCHFSPPPHALLLLKKPMLLTGALFPDSMVMQDMFVV
jgi:hypothetical protein